MSKRIGLAFVALCAMGCSLVPVGRVGDKAGRAYRAIVEVEEDVCTYEPPNNGSGPMWCHGNTCVIRVGDEVFASSLETIPGAKPLNNCYPLLFHRADSGWESIYKGEERTREPCPLVTFGGGRALASINPTLTEPDTYSGPAEPRILEFSSTNPFRDYETHLPTWDESPKFTEHSYRSFAADGVNDELILFQNIGYGHAEWAFLDRHGEWSAQGKLVWPWGAEYDKPQAIRTCYPTVAIRDRGVYFCGVSDIVEPYDAWREYKHELTGRKWDYDFRRLFYTWSDDIGTGEFHEWVEISSRDKTAGWIFPRDLYVAPNGDVFVMWTERAIDERLREKFFPDEKQRFSLEYAIIRDGNVVQRTALVEGGDDLGGERPNEARFQVTEEGRLLIFYHVGGTNPQGEAISENRIVEVYPSGEHGESVVVGLEKPLTSFFSATVRAGCDPSNTLDLYGDLGGTMRYVRIKLEM